MPENSDVPAGGQRPTVLSPACLIAIRADGIHVLRRQSGTWPVSYPHLLLLSRLDADPHGDPPATRRGVAAETGVADADLGRFMIDLRYSGYLGEGEPASAADVPDHPLLAATPTPFDLDRPGTVSIPVPQTLRIHRGSYELLDHEGQRVATLDAHEAAAVGRLGTPTAARSLVGDPGANPDQPRLTEEQVAILLGRLHAVGALRLHGSMVDLPAATSVVTLPQPDENRDDIVAAVFARHAEAQTAAEREREQTTGRRRTKVIPVSFDLFAPAALGMVVAYAKAFDGGRLEDAYDFRTDWVWSDDRFEEFTAEPAVYLFSDYLWSHQQCIDVSERVKAANPANITIHGGPDAPKYEGDAAAHMAAHPHVDVIIRGEGEVTAAEALAALAPVIGSDPPDLSVLADVPGLTYRDGDRLIRTADRERIADLDILPSPILTGLFDVYRDVPGTSVTMETNRGCPYGCTFCDWGSATTSRIRKFSLDRVFAELDRVAELGINIISVADSNFGIFSRDVEIARHVAELRSASGHPSAFGVSYAKNTVKHLKDIISILSDAGIMSMGVLSLQTMDEVTLDAIHRSNIKTEKYDAMANEMRRSQLPLMVELMVGLPGQTLDAFAEDLQQCIDRGVPARINMTTLLVNSPMNAPDYLAEHQIETSQPLGPGLNTMVVATSSYTREDHRTMMQLRSSFMTHENYGVLRHVARFVRQETGVREIDLYRRIYERCTAAPHRWPSLAAFEIHGPQLMAPPHSWSLVMGDLRRFLVEEIGLVDDDALTTILETQCALLPAFGRTFPTTLALPHDVVAWNDQITDAKVQGHLADWTELVPRLGSYPPGELTVDDPHHLSEWALGVYSELNSTGMHWELDSRLARAAIVPNEMASTDRDADVVRLRDVQQRTSVPVTIGKS